MTIALAALTVLSGVVPAGLTAPARIEWVSANPTSLVICSLQEARQWTCTGDVSAGGVIVIAGENGVAYSINRRGADAAMTVRRFGRLLATTAGTAGGSGAPVTVSVATVDRPPLRPHATRLFTKPVDNVDIVTVSRDSVWIAWDEADADAFLTVNADDLATSRIRLQLVADGDAAVPFVLAPALPITLTGRVENRRGVALDATEVELAEFLEEPPVDASDADLLTLPMVQTRRAITTDAGEFAFDRLGAGPLVVSVIDATRGRARIVIRSALNPVTIRVSPPPLATGRVLSHDVPVPGARVRFVPNVQTLIAALDIRDSAAVTVQSDEEGRFSLALPPATDGTVQVIGLDGNTTRLPPLPPHVTADIEFGDISLPDHRRLVVRLSTTAECVLNAVGPTGSLGVSIVAESAASANLHWFDLPEPGQWMLEADCGGRTVALVPPIVLVPAEGPDTMLDTRLAGTR